MNETKRSDIATDTEFLRGQLNEEKRKMRYRNLLKKTAVVLVAITAVSILVSTLWMPVLKIYSSSMEPTLQKGDIVLSVKTNRIETGELIAFYVGNKTLIKRVIAKQGDVVEIDDNGNVFVNEVLLDEPYISDKEIGETDIKYPYEVPESRYFVMGDNRSISLDSRSEYIGCITEKQVVGKVLLRIWPINRFGKI